MREAGPLIWVKGISNSIHNPKPIARFHETELGIFGFVTIDCGGARVVSNVCVSKSAHAEGASVVKGTIMNASGWTFRGQRIVYIYSRAFE